MATKKEYLKMAEACYLGHSEAEHYGNWIRSYNVMHFGKRRWRNKYPELFNIYDRPLDYKSRVFLILLAGELCK